MTPSRRGADAAVRVIPAQAGIHGRKRTAVLGAAGTGKTRLARELAAHLQQHACGHEVLEGSALPELPCDVILLLGLDLPSAAGGEAADAQLRAQLHSAGVNYQVVYGTGEQRLRSALLALAAAGVLPAAPAPRQQEGGAARAWTWACEKCSDPGCEHRLFTRLRQERTAPAADAGA